MFQRVMAKRVAAKRVAAISVQKGDEIFYFGKWKKVKDYSVIKDFDYGFITSIAIRFILEGDISIILAPSRIVFIQREKVK